MICLIISLLMLSSNGIPASAIMPATLVCLAVAFPASFVLSLSGYALARFLGKVVPRKGFFRISLSTAVVLMLVTGVLLFLNTRRSEREWYYRNSGPGYQHFYGWPYKWHVDLAVSNSGSANMLESTTYQSVVFQPEMLSDALIALGLLLLTAIAFETWARIVNDDSKRNEPPVW